MIRILFFLLLVFTLGLGFSWLAERPGDLVMTIGGIRYEVTVMVAAVAIVALVAVIMLAWWVLKSLWNSPRAVGRYFRARKRDRGYQTLSTGMIAAGAGDTALARRMTGQAGRLLDSTTEPLLLLLDAQSSLLEGDHDAARGKFEAMVDDPETRVLGLRGLFLEAQRLSDRSAARHYAQRAAEIAPQLEWATNATLEFKAAEGDWEGALSLVETQRSTRQIDKATANRRRAVLLTAKAIETFDTDQTGARAAAIEANRLAPDLVPAAVAAARAHFRQGDLRKGSKLLETIWKDSPHPEIADAYVHARAGDSAADRMKRAAKLAALKQNHPESLLAVARTAYGANDFAKARDAVEAALRIEPREGAYLLLADIEEAETGDQGRIRFWLSKAVRAYRDPAWTADGYVSGQWAPVSPVTGRLDAFEWRVPVEQSGPVIDDFDRQQPPALAIGSNPVAAASANTGTSVVEAEVSDEQETVEIAAKPEPASKAFRPAGESGGIAPPKSETPETGNEKMVSRPPDDPGVNGSETEESPKKFRLF